MFVCRVRLIQDSRALGSAFFSRFSSKFLLEATLLEGKKELVTVA
jgi:hypothetical protein